MDNNAFVFDDGMILYEFGFKIIPSVDEDCGVWLVRDYWVNIDEVERWVEKNAPRRT